MRCAKYDPNYMDGGDDVDDDNNDDDESMFDEDSDNGLVYESDDDDMSWKVRRAALRCVRTIVSSRLVDGWKNCSLCGQRTLHAYVAQKKKCSL